MANIGFPLRLIPLMPSRSGCLTARVAGFEQRYMHIGVAAAGICGMRGPDAGNHIFGFLVGKRRLIECTCLSICKTLEPAFFIGLGEKGSAFAGKPVGNALQV